ncbi:MAG: MBL fold metallo-hydrolase [Eubacteriales bacterium]|nr:MBL fold metallo-hydrolase [Eubacteriales bacterium]
MNLHFIGASREVTGSLYLLRANGKNILVDCGMEQGKDTYINQPLPISPAVVDAVVLTHAHIDHSGMLPALASRGFRGPIHATPATLALCDIMLRDSAHIQEMEAEWQNRKAKRSGGEEYVPLYTQADAQQALNQFETLPVTETREILPGVRLTFTDAGHLLGSASATLQLTEDGVSKTIVFSGDIGNTNQPIINDPHYLSRADYVVMESTYGDRLHGPRPDYLADLADALQLTFNRGGNVVIPSFAVGRTQEILYFIREIKEKGMVKGHDGFPVYLDSPLAIKATHIFTQANINEFDQEMRDLLARGANPITFEDLRICETAEESKQINFEPRPCVIISASGMAEAGRIRHHLKHNLWRREATVLFVGYQAVGTLGRMLYDGEKRVKLFGETIQVAAEIRMLKAISGHADQAGLIRWLEAISPRPARVFITHGDEDVAVLFKELLEQKGYATYVPYSGDVWSLSGNEQLETGSPALAKGKGKQKKKQVKADAALSHAMERLALLAAHSEGFSNRLKDKLARQINDLARRWEE